MIAHGIYLDHNATTPLLPEVIDAVVDACPVFGNPSSRHGFGEDARRLLDDSRAAVARLLGCFPEEVVFTSGGSEGANLAILGVLAQFRDRPGHVITSAIEHSAVLEACSHARTLGFALTIIPVDGSGRVDPEAVRRAIRPDTRLISIMHANNETGVVQPIARIAEIARECGVPMHTDAVQTAGKLPLGPLDVDLLSISGHKLHAPKGVGALRVRGGLPLSPLIRGGGQESGRRAGTENLLGITGLAAAARTALAGLDDADYQATRLTKARALAEPLLALPGVRLNGADAPRLPETVSLAIHGIRGDALVDLLAIQGVAASTGSACHAGSTHPSHVLLAMGMDADRAWSSVRFSLGRAVSPAQVHTAVEIIRTLIGRLRRLSPQAPVLVPPHGAGMKVALKNLLFERFRFVAALIGASFAVLLVLVMVGIYVGTTNQVTTYIDHTAGRVWVMQPGVNQMFRAVSTLPDETAAAAATTDGVAGATEILGVPSSFLRDGQQTAYYLLGFDLANGDVAGPWNIAEGRTVQANGETVLDRVLARKNGVVVGDTVDLIHHEFTVVGLSEETAAVGNFYAFISLADARQVLGAPTSVSYALLTPENGLSAQVLADRVRADIPGVEALTAEEFAENSRQIVVSMIGRPLVVMIAIGVAVGAAVIALTVLSLASEQRRDFGVLKAIGSANRRLYRIVAVQAVLLALGGYVIGGAVAYGAQYVIRERLGDVSVEITPVMLAGMLVTALLMALVGSVIPVRRVASVDPAEAFRA